MPGSTHAATRPRRPGSTSPSSLVVRALALGVAAGSRSTLGVAAPVLGGPAEGTRPERTGAVRVGGVVAVAAVVGETAGDKLPTAPSRLAPPGPVFRLASGAVGGVLLARRRGAPRSAVAAAALAGIVGSAAGTWGGAAWRGLAAGKRPDWPGAVAEDVAALALAAWAVRP